MNAEELYAHAFASVPGEKWHWFSYHFEKKLRGADSPFADAIIGSCIEIDAAIPGFAVRTIDMLAAISGSERHKPHYEQLLQLLSEVLVIRQLVRHQWPSTPTFTLEPTAATSNVNPEVAVDLDDVRLAVEVKAPSLLAYQEARQTGDAQLVARSDLLDSVAKAVGGRENVVLPRDNPIKDFFISADAKFSALRSEATGDFYGVLVIVWDDFIGEALNPLVYPRAGLFTPHSFAQDKAGARLTFNNVDGVILVRHLHQFIRAAGEQPLADGLGEPFDFGFRGTFPPRAYVPNPQGQGLPAFILDAFEAEPWDSLYGAEYSGQIDAIFWLG